jgi:tyrosyl-tRNA synthetase
VEIRADIELGGTDQTFNNLIGRELQRGRGQDPQVVLTVPLLVGTDGVEKMGKSLGNWIALSESPEEQFGKVMSIPDTLVEQYATLCTPMLPRNVVKLAADVEAGGSRANLAKRTVAREIVTLYHGSDAATEAEERFNAVHVKRQLQGVADEFRWDLSGSVHLPAMLTAAGLADTNSAARRLIDAGSVRIDGEPAKPREYDLAGAAVVDKIVSVGRRRAVRIVSAS